MNPFSERFEVVDLGESTSSEVVAQQFPDARVVKAFNTLYWEILATRGTKHVAHRCILPLASDDLAAKAIVSGLISDCGFAPMDVGTLREGGEWQQPNKLLFNRPLTVKEAEELFSSRRKSDLIRSRRSDAEIDFGVRFRFETRAREN